MASFQNIYYKRTAATAKACYMCFRPTTTVLATLNATDFIYTCDGHLTDQGFATLIEPTQVETPTATGAKTVSDEEIRRIKEEWDERQKERQKRAQEKDKAKAGDKDKDANEKDASKGDKKDASKESGSTGDKSTVKAPPPPPSPIPVPGSSAAAKPTHQRYTLHRDVWSMRLAEHKKKRQTTAVKNVAPRLPMTPRGGVA